MVLPDICVVRREEHMKAPSMSKDQIHVARRGVRMKGSLVASYTLDFQILELVKLFAV